MKLHCTASADQLKNSDTVALLLSEENAKSIKQCIPSDIDFLIKKADLSFFLLRIFFSLTKSFLE